MRDGDSEGEKMNRLRRWVFNGLAAMSLLMCLATLGLWVRAVRIQDTVLIIKGAREICLEDGPHVLSVSIANDSLAEQFGPYVFDRHFWPDFTDNNLGMYMTFAQQAWVDQAAPDIYDYVYGARVGPPLLITWTPPAHFALGFGWEFTRFHTYGERYTLTWPIWLTAMFFGLLPGFRAWRVISPRRRRWEMRCDKCGYDLRATPDRCPECGTVTAKGKK